VAWSLGADGETPDELAATLDANAKAQIEFWTANAQITDEPRIVGDTIVRGRLTQEQVLDPHDEQVAQVTQAVAAAKLLAEGARGPLHAALSGHYATDPREQDSVTVVISQMR
jgi:hypothetical protein